MSTANVNGATLYYSESGKGLPLVLLHAFPVDGRMWNGQVAELSGQARVIVPDFRGFGRSPEAGPFTISSLADDIHALLGQLHALPCVLAGLSMGGYVAMNYALRHARDLRGLILIDTKAEGDTAEQKANRDRMIDVVRSKGATAIAELMIGKMLGPDTVERRPAVVGALRSMMESCPPTTIAHALAAMRDRADVSGEIGRIEVPTFAVVGDADAITPPRVMEEIAGKIEGARMTVVPGAGHMAPMEQPELVNHAIGEFLSGMLTGG